MGGSPGGAATRGFERQRVQLGEETGAGSFLSETETARCFPPSLGPPRRSCGPGHRGLPPRGPTGPQCTPNRPRWARPPAQPWPPWGGVSKSVQK